MGLTVAAQIVLLETRRDTVLAELAAMTQSTVGGSPNAGGTGDNVDHVGHRQSLLEELKSNAEIIDTLNGGSMSVRKGRLS